MNTGILLQEGVQTGIINGAGVAVTVAGLAIVAVWWAYLYREASTSVTCALSQSAAATTSSCSALWTFNRTCSPG